MTAGRPTHFKTEFVEQARKLYRIGASNTEVADFFGIGTTTLYCWRQSHPEFAAATVDGKDRCDDQVERSLHRRAIGYEHEAVRIFMPAGAKEPVIVPYPVHVIPDVRAAQHWLRFRRPEQWSDRRPPKEEEDSLHHAILEAFQQAAARREREGRPPRDHDDDT
jgi:hypothetical protein